jgi:transposase-like protein
MRKRRKADEVARLLEADRDLAKGLTVADICRKLGIAQTTYHRWRQRHLKPSCVASTFIGVTWQDP